MGKIERLVELDRANLNKTIGLILENLERVRDAYTELNTDDILDGEVHPVLATFTTQLLPSIMMMAAAAEGLVVATKTAEEPN